jgi:RHH-type proline utilization regulon transcriptional repressor/proline dehydrogenase/delta 1-pyrroline-5-carboxylate dehydrogenase
MSTLNNLRSSIRLATVAPTKDILTKLDKNFGLEIAVRQGISTRAEQLIDAVRTAGNAGLMELFLAEYGLSTDEGIALMCLAEALLRVPDAATIDALIEDKIAPSAWGVHLGKSSSSLVNASTWALMLTGKVLSEETSPVIATTLRSVVRRLGEPVIRLAVQRAMREMGQQFVLGQTINEAIKNGRTEHASGRMYSYDMLGEAAVTTEDADSYFQAYLSAINDLAAHCGSEDIRTNPGISIKLSALYPRYEDCQQVKAVVALTHSVLILAKAAKSAGMGLNIDAEEADRLELSLDIIEAVVSDPAMQGWDGFGVVVQAYGKRASHVLAWLNALATVHDRNLMVRLVKGAYWDTEIKLAQELGLLDYPVYCAKSETDFSYICCANQLLTQCDRLYPQFATHNAHTVAAVMEIAGESRDFEFQRLHGMGQALHTIVAESVGTRCRIYAPVGAHRDLLAYLVRRLLENGANSSFVSQIMDETLPSAALATDPTPGALSGQNVKVRLPQDIFQPQRKNSAGWNVQDRDDREKIQLGREPFQDATWLAGPITTQAYAGQNQLSVFCPSDPTRLVGTVIEATPADAQNAISGAKAWNVPAKKRSEILFTAADELENAAGQLFALLAREAGKCLPDAIAELREAVDFLRYYAASAADQGAENTQIALCISPWNFPLAIFCGQISAALATGCAVIAKPAEATSLIGALVVKLLHKSGVPVSALQFLPGRGSVIGDALTQNPKIGVIAFTGSHPTAQRIHGSIANCGNPAATLIAETGGLNAMIVDSTALPEQAVRDIVISAFQSAGQRCSALRLLYVQEDVADTFKKMLFGAMDVLELGDPWRTDTDVGPVISREAQSSIASYIDGAQATGRLLHRINSPKTGHFVGPAVIEVDGIADLPGEVFGPVLHLATYRQDQLETVIDDINKSGFGLTFGVHTRIDDRVDTITSALNVGNIYVNRNQIGAIVGSQPFGGEGLSGTGPKAGGPNYLKAFMPVGLGEKSTSVTGPPASAADIQQAIDNAPGNNIELCVTDLPGPTGESNRLTEVGRGVILCAGPSKEESALQAKMAIENGCYPVQIARGCRDGVDGTLSPETLAALTGYDGVAYWGNRDEIRILRQALAAREGKIIPMFLSDKTPHQWRLERHVCIDTTASGGNAALLASMSD